MGRSVVSGVMWLGRATVFAVGLAVILALLFVVAKTVLGVGDGPAIPGESGQANGIAQFVEGAGGGQALAVEPLARRRPPPPQGYAWVTTSPPFFDPSRSKGIVSIQRAEASNSNPDGELNVYCFDLSFTPKVAVASPFFWNNTVVGTVTPPNSFLTSTCPATHDDMAARTYAANTSADTDEVSFSIVFR
jgi:hypothetical protein